MENQEMVRKLRETLHQFHSELTEKDIKKNLMELMYLKRIDEKLSESREE